MTKKNLSLRNELKEKLAKSCNILPKEIDCDLPGHLSCRVPDTNEILIKPRRISWGKLRADDVVSFNLDIDLDKEIKTRELYKKHGIPSELPIHTEVYKKMNEVTSILHIHPFYSTLIGTLGLKFELLNTYTLAFRNGVPIYDESDDPTYGPFNIESGIRSQKQGQILAKKLMNSKSQAIIMKYHGVVTVGRSIEETCLAARSLEKAAKSQIIASLLHGKQGKSLEELELPPLRQSWWTSSGTLWNDILESY